MSSRSAYFYILGDPYNRFAISKIGITQNLENRLLHIYSRENRLQDGVAVFGLYALPDRLQAAELERTLLRVFRRDKADSRTLAWIAIKPAEIDLRVDLVAEHLGLEWSEIHFPYRRWQGEPHAPAWRIATEQAFEIWLPALRQAHRRAETVLRW